MGSRTRVLVLAPNWLGDAVMALPALADVRRAFGAAHLMVGARASLARLFALVPGVDEIVELEWRGTVRAPGAFRRDALRLRAARPDLALVLPNSFAAALLAWSAGASDRWGYAADGRRVLLSRAVAKPAASMSQASYYQHLTAALGIPAGALDAGIAVPGEALNGAADLLRQAGRDDARPFVVLAPGAAYGTAKRWPPAHFARLAAELVSRLGVQCVIVGTGADAATSAEILAAVPAVHRREVIDLCGRTDLERLAGVLALARACVSNDSGAMHLAAAAGVPLAALFGPTNERETAPVPRPGTPAHVLIHPVACRPCMLRDCPIDHPCMRNLAPDRVFGTVAGMLGDERDREARG